MTSKFHVFAYLITLPLLFLFVWGVGKYTRSAALRVAAIGLGLFAAACVLLWFDCRARAVGWLCLTLCASSLTLPAGGTKPLSDALGARKFALYLLCVGSLAALFFIYLPIIVFLTSPGELSIHLQSLIETDVRDAMVVVFLAAFAYAVAASPRLRSVLALLALASLLLCLVYSFVLPFGYPNMNGLMFEQIPVPRHMLALRFAVDGVAVVGVVLLSVKLLVRFTARTLIPAIVLLNVSLTAACIASVASDLDTDEAAAQGAAQVERPLALSKTKSNVLVLFLDRLMGGFIEPILEQEPGLGARLDGFTWYPRTVAAGENSIAGAHPLLGGYDYTPREMNKRGLPLREVAAESYAILPLNFIKKGYAASVLNPRMLGFTLTGDCSFLKVDDARCTHVPLSVTKKIAEEYGVPMQVLAESNYADLLLLLGVMRGTPYALKAVLNRRGPWQKFIDHSAGTTFREWAELKSLPLLTSTDAKTDTYNIYSNALPHEPYFVGEDCKPLSTKLTVSDEELERRGYASLFELQHATAARCAMLLVADYVDWLKKEGVYDNTTVVIVSDHGIVGPVEDHSSRAKAGGTTSAEFVKTRSALLVKPKGAHGALQASEEYMPNAELPRILCAEIGGCTNPFLGDKTIEAHGRDDPFTVSFVPWQFNRQKPTAFKIVKELELRGRDPYAASNWHVVDKK